MKAIDALKQSNGGLISVEIEPPMVGRSIKEVFDVLDPLVDCGVAYVDITYHPEQIIGHVKVNGDSFPVSMRKKPGTVGVAGAILGRYGSRGVVPVPHVICTGFTKYSTEEYLIELGFLGVENVMALRGDPAGGIESRQQFCPAPGGHAHANELVMQIADLKRGVYVGAKSGESIDFCVGAGCYPEGHAESRSPDEELRWLKMKVYAGVDYLTTQMFFDNEKYYRFVESAARAGITVPIVPGIKPLTSISHLRMLPGIFGCSIPRTLAQLVERHQKNPDDVKKTGIEWCIDQCRDLREHGVPSLHFYAARNAPIIEIIRAL
ncbi:methylenetetrahydrofolate reductase [Candidatus Woesearchaeota archaeon]|nr:methylenetetrahydrofolate reductase [Candidatus Woesearchaeota archaeon]